ncbi:MAG: S41 family peptidase [Ruthenibacterium lactatiformans]
MEVPEGKNVGYVQITTFDENTVSTELTACRGGHAGPGGARDGVGLDVRGNDGGSLDYAMDVIDALCPVGPIASRQNKDGDHQAAGYLRQQRGDLPMVVLVNGSTAAGPSCLPPACATLARGALWAPPRRARA